MMKRVYKALLEHGVYDEFELPPEHSDLPLPVLIRGLNHMFVTSR